MRHIGKMFNPKTIALIGATDKPESIGKSILDNLLRNPDRTVFPINPTREEVLGLPVYSDISSVREHIDLAIIATPGAEVIPILEACEKAGVEGATIVSSGFGEMEPDVGEAEERIRKARRDFSMRIMGPNCLGVIRPRLGLNTTPLTSDVRPGNIALVSQSGGFGRALLEWGIENHIGFSMFASLGSMIDIDLGDIIDFLGYDPYTRSIMVYMEESFGDVKKFVSAARGFARNKPIVLLKPGKTNGEMRQCLSHSGFLATSDRVYDAVFKRVGVVRAKTATDLFNAAGVLYSKHRPKGPRLLVLTNADGIGVMAVNALRDAGGKAATLSEENLDHIRKLMPPYWKDRKALDLLRDADVTRYVEVLRICLEDPEVDGVLVIFTPQDSARSDELATAIADLANKAWKPVITTWMGGKEAQVGRDILLRGNVPTYVTPEEAVRTYLYMYKYERNLEILHETPADVRVDASPPNNTLKALVRKVVAEGRTVLTEEESKRFLINYGIPTVKTHFVTSVEQAASMARRDGYPVALKVVSPEITYKSDAGGIALGISSEEELRDEFAKMMTRVEAYCPTCTVKGVTVQRMIENIDYEIILGAKKDPEFGSVILFGMGGIDVQIYQDFSIGLPPLNQALARKLMEETRAYRLLQGYRGRPPADLPMLEKVIMSFSNLIVDFPEIAEMDINPIALLNGKAYALDARIILDPDYRNNSAPYPHLIITPYPTRYISHWQLADGTDVLLRPVRPEDEPLEHEMLTSLSPKTIKERFFQPIKQITHEMHVRMCNIDYEREIAIVAEVREGGRKRIVGTGRLIMEPDLKRGEFAVIVHDEFQGQGLGYKLVDTVIGIGHEKGLEEIYGFVLSENSVMLNMCRKMGCSIEPTEEDPEITKVSLSLA
jgi:acetyltransferase